MHAWFSLEMDGMSKFAYPRMRIRLIPAREAPRIRIQMRIPAREDHAPIPAHEDPRMRINMRIPGS